MGVDVKWMLHCDAESSVTCSGSFPAFLGHTRDRATATRMDLPCLYWTWTSNHRHLKVASATGLEPHDVFSFEDLFQGGLVGFDCHILTKQVVLELL